MPRLLRDTDPSKFHLVSTRTERAELLFVPCNEVNNIIGGVIARYAKLCHIEIFAYCVLSNHYHLLVRAPSGNLSDFVSQVNREIAKRVNRYLGREGHFWSSRFDDSIVADLDGSLQALLYVVTNPTKHGLVSDPKQWPGLTCYSQLFRESSRTFKFMNFSKYSKALRRARLTGEIVHKSDYEETVDLKLDVLPALKNLSREKRAKELSKILQAKTLKLRAERKAAGKGFLGRKNVLRQPKTGVFPREVSRKKRKIFYCETDEARRELNEERKEKHIAYKSASYLFRLGKLNTKFPPFCFKPPLHQKPRLNFSFALAP